jgi:hypothetical protein
MLTILWNPHKHRVVTMFPPIASFIASWFIDGNVVPLVERFFAAGWNTV